MIVLRSERGRNNGGTIVRGTPGARRGTREAEGRAPRWPARVQGRGKRRSQCIWARAVPSYTLLRTVGALARCRRRLAGLSRREQSGRQAEAEREIDGTDNRPRIIRGRICAIGGCVRGRPAAACESPNRSRTRTTQQYSVIV